MGGDVTTFYYSRTATVLPTITGLLSFASSVTIIATIIRSRIFSQYHRILLFMSFWDAVTSLAIACTTRPMPKDYDLVNGPTMGTVGTCEAQAFIILTGSGFIFCSNTFLTVYYLCTIKYRMKDETIKKYLEPIFLLVATCLSLCMPIFFLVLDALNPTPVEPYCLVGEIDKNFYCDDANAGAEYCVRGEKISVKQLDFFKWFVVFGVLAQLLVLLVSMVLIVHTFYVNDKVLKRVMYRRTGSLRPADTQNNSDESFVRASNSLRAHTSSMMRIDQQNLQTTRLMTKIVTQQASMYIIAFIITWVFVVVSFFQDNRGIGTLKCLFQPLQGFFNLIIFLYHKVFDFRRMNPNSNLTIYEALKTVVLKPRLFNNQDYISCMSVVRDDPEMADRDVEPKWSNDGVLDVSEDPQSIVSSTNLSSESKSIVSAESRLSLMNGGLSILIEHSDEDEEL